MDIRTFIRKDLRDMVNYQVQPVRGIKMDANESPFPMSRELRGEIAKWIQEEETFGFTLIRIASSFAGPSLRQAVYPRTRSCAEWDPTRLLISS
ncbi:MAG: hypothetical protein ACLTDS_17075 [Bianqueaceae bacterium]